MDVPEGRPNLTAEVIRRLRTGDYNERFYPELIKAWYEQMQRMGYPPIG